MKHDNRTATYSSFPLSDKELSLLKQMREGTHDLFAPLDHSLAASVVGTVEKRNNRRRVLQSFWLGCAPAVAVFLVLGLYLGSFMVTRPAAAPAALLQSSGLAAGSTQKELDNSCTADLGEIANSMRAVAVNASCKQKVTVVLQGDVLRRELLITWLRTAHSDAAGALQTAATGQTVEVQLTKQEARDLVALLRLHGFTVHDASHLLAFALEEAWSGSVDDSITIAFLP